MNQTFEKDPAEALDYSVEFIAHAARYREPNTDYNTSTKVQPKRATGLEYNASTGGRTGTDEPRWPTTVAQTVTDGSVIWTAAAISTASLTRTLSSATWTADTGLTVSGQALQGTKSTATISGGTLGQTYLVRVDGTFSDATVRTATFWVTIARPRTVSA